MAGLALTAAVAVGLAGCSASAEVSTGKTADVDKIETAIKEQYAAQKVPLSALDCEDDIGSEKGAPIVCSGTNAEGTVLDIRGSITDTAGNGRFSVRTVGAAAKGTTVAAAARASLEKKYDQKLRSLTCPETVPIPTKATVPCEVTTLDGQRIDAKLSLDAEGKIHIDVADEITGGP